MIKINSNKKSIPSQSLILIILVLVIILIVNCSQPFTFSGVLDGLGNGFEGEGSGSFADIDYIVHSITNPPASANVDTSFTQSFIFENQSTDPGASTVYWTAYFSEDTVLDGGDTLVNHGSTTALGALSSSEFINITGIWPSSAGIYYLIVNVSSGDDIDPSNNYLASSSFTINATGTLIDYKPANISRDYPTVSSGSLCSETFDLSNIGGGNGADDILWTAYASPDNNLNIGTDDVIASGTLSALDAGIDYSSVPISGSWPATADDYYIFIDISASNEDITDNNTVYNGPYTVKNPPDYYISLVHFLSEGVPGDPLSGITTDYDFIITENAGNNGSQQIGWEVFISIDTILDGSDIPIKDGNLDALTAGSSSGSNSFSDGNWPASVGRYYYIIISINAGDDSNLTNNTYVSSNLVAVPVSYLESDGVAENYSVGPSSIAAGFPNVSNLFLPSSTIGLNDLFKITCEMDANGEFDTYKFKAGSLVTAVDIYAEWVDPGFDPISIHFWDENDKEWISDKNSFTTEPATIPKEFAVIAEETYYVGVEFINPSVVAGTPYTLVLHAKP